MNGVPYRNLRFNFILQRYPAFYVLYIVIPCAALAFLGCLVLLLPNPTVETVSLEMTVLLAFTVFLLMVSDKVPTTGTVPMLGKHL